ncbi:hypothetical protein Dacet_0607 [Denitrovibrio acetiphilus DSM 12809]|jgi:hypothetical protein|uniref:Helix-turn-helix domain-containing protein n=1 Tax=Denitrovibrio acetiphilus (strain DSM 12809 / NBRC 114555 / N2460) TaxID=522772 RepID=D4H4K9_DENA2|nr:helix-turn-helix domain-containing protein [Denitrovibrio acetiphilus]ADD67403.1 hypothetical protein Dacet_0607 [Denitrovibrio acetiphilus DSM 12809]
MKERNIVVNEIYIPEKPDFMSKKRLAKELDVSEDTIDRWVKSEFLRYNVHYFVKDRVLRFFYPEIKILLAPKALKH